MGAGFLRVLVALDRKCEPLDDVAGGGATAVAEGYNRRAEDDRPGIVGGAAASSSATSTRNFRPPVSGVGLIRNTALAPRSS